MSSRGAEVVICGAGIAGLSAAYHLSVTHRLRDVVLVDELPPLSLTSDKSTECYRNWWPGPGNAMVALMNRSIDILEELAHQTGNTFNLSRRGYLFATAETARVADFRAAAEEAASLGAGELRIHTGQPGQAEYLPSSPEGYDTPLTGADLITDLPLIRKHFSYLSERTVAVLHARRCGWFSAQQLGMTLLQRARDHGTSVLQARLEGVDVGAGGVEAVHLASAAGARRIATRRLVIAAGPFIKPVAGLLGVALPIYSEFHAKIAFNEYLGLIPRHLPLLIWTDPQLLPWDEDERNELRGSADTAWMVEPFASGVHVRPEGSGESRTLLILWTYHTEHVEPVFPPKLDPFYPEIALRGLATMLPALRAYFGRAPKPVVDGGYYMKTQENRPLIGPLPVEGAFVIGALSGFGLMASPAAGEIVASHVVGAAVPSYAKAFLLERYQDPEYQKLLEDWRSTGQL